MIKNEIQKFYDNLERRDIRNEKYFFTIIAGGDDVVQSTMISHIDNREATGAKVFKDMAETAKSDGYEYVDVLEYKAFSSGSTNSEKPYATSRIYLKKRKPNLNNEAMPDLRRNPLEAVDEAFHVFGGLQGFMGIQAQTLQSTYKIERLEEKLDEEKEKNSSLLSKLGEYESQNKSLLKENTELSENLKKAQEAITFKSMMLSTGIQSGVVGLGNLLLNKGVIDTNTLKGVLSGFEAFGGGAQETQHQESKETHVPEVEIEPDLTPEQKLVKEYADRISEWIMKNNQQIAKRVYIIFDHMASSEANLNTLFELIDNEKSNI